MEIKKTTKLHEARFLNLFQRDFANKGKESSWIFCSRENEPAPHIKKTPDAVVIVGVLEGKLVVTSEFRVPIMAREWGFPAGLIEYNEDPREAAIREFKEEVGLDFEPTEVSAPNLYSSSGMSNESVQIVFGKAFGIPTTEHNEELEDIQIHLISQEDIADMLVKFENNELAVSDKAWCLFWHFSKVGM